LPLHDEVDVALVDDREPMASVQRPDRIPLEISKPKRHSTGVRDGKTVAQDPRPQPLSLMGGEEVELIETQMIGKSHEGDGANGLPLEHDPREWRVPEPLLMKVPLESLVPSPSHHDVRAHGRPFDLKGEVARLGRLRKSVKADVRRQVRNIHRSIFSRTSASSSEPELDPVRPRTWTARGVEACLGQQPDRGSIVGAGLGKHGSRGQPRIGCNLVQRRPERL